MNLQQKLAVIIVDILIVVQLCISMYFASQDPDNLTPVFVKTFFSMLIPTLILARVAIKRLRPKATEVAGP